MRSHLYGAIAIAAVIATPAISETTTPTSNTMSTPGPSAGTSRPTLSHDGSSSLTNSNAQSQAAITLEPARRPIPATLLV
jgi:hypothetical protein